MDSSVIHQSNGKLGMYLNIPIECASIYDDFIAQLQACKDGDDTGDQNITHGCLVQVSATTLPPKIMPKWTVKTLENSGGSLEIVRKVGKRNIFIMNFKSH